MKKYLSLFLFLILASTCFSKNLKAPKGIAGKAYQATFALYVVNGNDSMAICTAEIIHKTKTGYELLTAGHCVDEAETGDSFAVAEEMHKPLMPVKIVKFEHEAGRVDYAVLSLETKNKYPVLSIGDDSTERIGNSNITVGFSDMAGKQVSYGVIASSYMPQRDGCLLCEGNIIVQLFGGPGLSGGAVISAKTHKIIGIVVGGFRFDMGSSVEPISKIPLDKVPVQ